MKRVPIDDAVPGMVLAKAVTNQAGLTIIATGTALDESLIDRLRRMGVPAIYAAGSAAGEESGRTLAELEEDIARRFRKVAGDPLQCRIREAVRRRLLVARGVETAAPERTGS
jgi:hypothetical protein